MQNKPYTAYIYPELDRKVEEFLMRFRMKYNRKMTRTELMTRAIELFLEQHEDFLNK